MRRCARSSPTSTRRYTSGVIVRNVASLAAFTPEKMGKVSLAAGDLLYAGLNCFEPGQQHAAHVHTDQDKLYYAVSGAGEVTIGAETSPFITGDLALAPAGVEHAIRNSGVEPFTVLTIFAPPPKPR